MSKFPTQYDDDATLPVVNNNITEIGAEAINALREAVFNIEQEVGLGGSGNSGTIAARLGVSILPDGSINPSAITALGLVTLPITNSQISNTAAIPESKLVLDHSTQSLYNYILGLSSNVSSATGWISSTGIKLEPHLVGAIYKHTLSQIDVSTDPAQYFKNKFETLRNNSNSYTLIGDINNELLNHQFADGSPVGNIQNITTFNGSVYPSNYGHTASAIYLNTDRFSTIPQTAQDLQSFAQFIDNSSIFLYGTRIQNLYTNGISKISRSSSLSTDGYGAPIVPSTPAIAYLLNTGSNSSPFDDINTGDDIIEFKPATVDLTNNSFDEKFALVKIGDIIRVNYGSIEVGFVIKEKKYIQNGGNKKFIIRIAGKNLSYSTSATARIDRPLFNNNKFGVLAIAAANNEFSQTPSLIIGSPSGAMALGNGFNPDHLDSQHYLLYLALFPTGHPEDGYILMPGIDVTGNTGNTPGQYTIDSIVESTNNSFRKAGYNYRFIAYNYEGNYGIMLADSYNNAGFSIVNAVVDNNGNYSESETNINFPNNVIDVFTSINSSYIDGLGFGVTGSNVASPLYQKTYASAEMAVQATKLFVPLRRNNYYVNGAERDKLNLDIGQTLDGYGDGYWFGNIVDQSIYPGPIPVGRVQTTYRIMLDLSASNLKVGKTLVIQSLNNENIINFGRFIIQSINFGCYPNVYTDITVFDAVHGTGFSPTTTLSIGSEVAIYFSYDSVSFNNESATDFTNVSPFKRYFEVYVDLDGKTFTHERARINASTSNLVINGVVPFYGSSELSKLEIIDVSPKLRGYQFGSVNKISLNILKYDTITGQYDGYLSYYDGLTFTKKGPLTSGKFGETVRYFDETNVDFIDLKFGINSTVFNFTNQVVDIQLFPTLSLDEEVMLLATCQLNDINNLISNIKDKRQFGNTSEKDLSTSALNYISLPERLLNVNGVIRGFDLDKTVTNPNNDQIYISGGVVLVNGKFIDINPQNINIPIVKEIKGILYDINWAVCVNSKGEIQTIPLLDYDAVLGTPNVPERIFNAYNVNNGAIYVLDSTTFINLVTNRKDLTVLYIVSSVVTTGPTAISLSIMDARKFIYNESENIDLTWVPADEDNNDISGHFKTIDSLVSWINKFGTRNNLIKVRGEFNINQTIDFTGLLNAVKFIGNGAIFNITAGKGFKVKENVSFENITFNYNPILFTISGNINSDNGCIFGDTADTDFVSNINVKNCIFNSDVVSHPPFISFRVGSGKYIDSIQIVHNYFNDTNSTHDAAIAFLGTNTLYNVGQACLISNIDISKNICAQNQAFYFVNSYSQTGNSYSIPGVTAINVKIHENKMGYLGYTISGSNVYSESISGEQLFSVEKNQMIAIVGPLDETGKDPNIQATSIGNSGATGPGLPTGNIIIQDNDLNFIVSEARGSSISYDGYIGNLVINNNRLLAANYDVAIRQIFGLETILFTGTANLAITVNSRYYYNNKENTINTHITNNIIQGQKIEGVSYNYTAGIYAKQSCLISGNTIKDLINYNISGIDQGWGIYLGKQISSDEPHSKVHHNSIYRGTEGISFYIGVFNTVNADITDNFFDSSYKDAANTNEAVVFCSSSNNPKTVVDRNKNQIITSVISGIDGHITVNGYDVGSAISGNLISLVNAWSVNRQGARDPYETLLDQFGSAFALTTSGSSNFTVQWILSLKDYLPKGVTVISGSMRVVSTVSSGSNNCTLTFGRKKTHAGSVDTISDATSFSGGYVPNTIVNLSNNLTSNNWIIDPNEIYNVAYLLFGGTAVSASTVSVDCLILKYKW